MINVVFTQSYMKNMFKHKNIIRLKRSDISDKKFLNYNIALRYNLDCEKSDSDLTDVVYFKEEGHEVFVVEPDNFMSHIMYEILLEANVFGSLH